MYICACNTQRVRFGEERKLADRPKADVRSSANCGRISSNADPEADAPAAGDHPINPDHSHWSGKALSRKRRNAFTLALDRRLDE